MEPPKNVLFLPFLKFLIMLLVVILAMIFFSSWPPIIGGAAEKTVAIMILKTPIGVQEMRKKYIKTDTQPPHITIGYLNEGFDEKELLQHLRNIKPEPIIFDKWKHSESFIGLIPKNVNEIKRVIGPMAKYVETGPRGGYHMSLAYRPQSQKLDNYTHKKAHDLINVPFACKIKEIRISKYKHGDWYKYKSVIYD